MMKTESRPRALLIGNSDGIGLAWTRRLVAENWHVASLSRSACAVADVAEHVVLDVLDPGYRSALERLLERHGPFDLCAHLVATAVDFDPARFDGEADVFRINLMSLVEAMEIVVPSMVARGSGHVVGISSLADDLIVPTSPAYPATKAAMTSYLTGCARELRRRGVAVTNVRYGFVDTKMAQAPVKPFLVTPDRAVDVLMRVLRTRRVQVSWPKATGVLVRAGRWLQRPGVWLGKAR